MFIDLTKRNFELNQESKWINWHSSTGNDVVEKFLDKSKKTWVNAYLQAENKIVEAFTLYPKELVSGFGKEQEQFVCYVYVPESNVVGVKGARWIRFKMNLSNISLLPPPGTFHQHILRSHWHAKIMDKRKGLSSMLS